jgi:hypothetical protein
MIMDSPSSARQAGFAGLAGRQAAKMLLTGRLGKTLSLVIPVNVN